jgi:hypothetical protein
MIIAIAGRKQSGKDTVAEHLAEQYGFIPYALAAPLKAALLQMFGFTPQQLFGTQKDDIDSRYGITPRQAMQTLGTDWAQHTLMEKFPVFNLVTGRDLWVKRFFYGMYSPMVNWVVHDVRFQHELDGLRDICEDTYSVFIHRPGSPEDDHESEAADLDTDFEIYNDGSLEELLEATDIFMEEFI